MKMTGAKNKEDTPLDSDEVTELRVRDLERMFGGKIKCKSKRPRKSYCELKNNREHGKSRNSWRELID